MKLIRKPLVVVGIDPGTTLGYAVLDLEGCVLKIGSERGGSLKRLIEESTYYGIPVIAATDKAKCPELVHQFSAKTGARIVAPPADLQSWEKKILMDGIKNGNDHEMDSLSAARFGLKKYLGMLKKVEVFLREAKKEKFSDDVKRLLIQRDGIGIAEAVRIVEQREKGIPAAVERFTEEEEFVPSREDYLKLKERLNRLDDEYRKLRQSQEFLLDELDKAESDGEETPINGATKNRKLNWLMRLKTKRIRELEKRLNLETERSARLKKLISELGPNILLKRLNNLTYDEFLKQDKLLKIHEGDILLVEDVNSHSKKTLEALKGRVTVIIYKGRIASDVRSNRDLIFLDASKLRLWELDEFALVDKAELERLRRDSSKVADMFEKYRESRKRNGQ